MTQSLATTDRVKVVLFDIDGTILWTDGAGRRAMEGALTYVFGSPGSARYRYDGKTDRQIAREQMRVDGWDDAAIDAELERLCEHYLERLMRELDGGVQQAHRYDGVLELLDALDARADRVLGLLTGNLERGARAKLRAVGIDADRFVVNAFGSDHEVRDELPAVAQRRARAHLGTDVAGSAIVIVGDTPADIACGRGIGARAIAVATGRYSVEELTEHAPYAVFRDLTDTEAVLRAIDDA